MKQIRHFDYLSLSDSDATIIEQSKKQADPLLSDEEKPMKHTKNILEKHLKLKFLMKVLSCEDFEKISNTYELDKMMKKRKKDVSYMILLFFSLFW